MRARAAAAALVLSACSSSPQSQSSGSQPKADLRWDDDLFQRYHAYHVEVLAVMRRNADRERELIGQNGRHPERLSQRAMEARAVTEGEIAQARDRSRLSTSEVQKIEAVLAAVRAQRRMAKIVSDPDLIRTLQDAHRPVPRAPSIEELRRQFGAPAVDWASEHLEAIDADDAHSARPPATP